jgi:gamma-glutamyltranspeptidase/glutathione hydrolase
MVSSADHRASAAGLAALDAGGTAVDAAIAANAVLAVTSPHLCGLGGDLYALVYSPGAGTPPVTLSAAGRAGSGADPAALREAGHTSVPLFGEIQAVTVPGCVDGWLALHSRYARLPLTTLLAPAERYAADGFSVAPLLAAALPVLDGVAGNDDFFPAARAAQSGQVITRAGVARTLASIGRDGRDGFYAGEFGAGLIAAAGGLFTAADLSRQNASWAESIAVTAWGHRLWTAPPASQGYLALLAAAIADGLELPGGPDDPRTAHLLIEAAIAAGHDRLARLHADADVRPLLAPGAIQERRRGITPGQRARLGMPTAAGGTTCICAVDRDGLAVVLLESNAAQFGARIFEPSTRINLHNRGLGFSLTPGHPALLAPGARPAHTLSPLIVTRSDGTLRAVLGTRGGDSQPQLLLQLLARVLHFGQPAGLAMAAPRWELAAPATNGFNAWTEPADLVVQLEPGAPASWHTDLAALGYDVRVPGGVFGHAQLIGVDGGGVRGGAADPRAVTGGVAVQ